MTSPARLYTAVIGALLLLQGTVTLAFRILPALDEAFPVLLATTRMIPPHSVVHIVTGLLAMTVLRRGGSRGPLWFAAGFGLFYVGLAIVGASTGHPRVLGLQSFDHGIHAVIGGLGLLAAGLESARERQR